MITSPEKHDKKITTNRIHTKDNLINTINQLTRDSTRKILFKAYVYSWINSELYAGKKPTFPHVGNVKISLDDVIKDGTIESKPWPSRVNHGLKILTLKK